MTKFPQRTIHPAPFTPTNLCTQSYMQLFSRAHSQVIADVLQCIHTRCVRVRNEIRTPSLNCVRIQSREKHRTLRTSPHGQQIVSSTLHSSLCSCYVDACLLYVVLCVAVYVIKCAIHCNFAGQKKIAWLGVANVAETKKKEPHTQNSTSTTTYTLFTLISCMNCAQARGMYSVENRGGTAFRVVTNGNRTLGMK